jgi:hypothetical protein
MMNLSPANNENRFPLPPPLDESELRRINRALKPQFRAKLR